MGLFYFLRFICRVIQDTGMPRNLFSSTTDFLDDSDDFIEGIFR